MAQQRGIGTRYIALLSRLKERPYGEAVSAEPPHACDGMALALEDPRVPLEYLPEYREYGLRVAGSPAFQIIEHCPWCGSALPPSLRDEYFDRLDAMGMEPGDADVPADFASDAWWKRRAIGGDQ
jgi:hypothetical protein